MSESVFVILVGFFGIQQKNIFTNLDLGATIPENPAVIQEAVPLESKDITPITSSPVASEKYVNSGLTEEKSEQVYGKLQGLINEDKVYTNANLSLSELASKLETHPNYLSQIINEKESKTFYDFINAYRVEEFKKRIAIPKNQQFTLVSIAYDCGFNSKSSFNRHFKKITGLTPSQYAKPLKA